MENVKMAYQVPIPLLEEYQGDFDFALAHLIMHDGRYERFYAEQGKKGRTVFLDNGIHELGQPVTIDYLWDVASLIHPTHIIPPDWHGENDKSFQAAELATWKWPRQMIAPVVQGQTFDECLHSYKRYVNSGYTTICLPYRLGAVRLQLIPHLVPYVVHHFLGFNYIMELKEMRKAPNPQCDTGKPFRFAQRSLTVPMYERATNDIPKLDMKLSELNSIALGDSLDFIRYAATGDPISG